MIYAHMCNKVRETVYLVTQCKNQPNAQLTTLNQLPLYKEVASMNTPAHAVKYTNRMQEISATGRPARPP
jgi:hypothetical protein